MSNVSHEENNLTPTIYLTSFFDKNNLIYNNLCLDVKGTLSSLNFWFIFENL